VPGALILGGAHGSLAVARSLGRRQIPIWFVTHDHPLTALSRYIKRSFSWPGPDHEGALDFLLDLALRYRLDGWVLFPGGDGEVRFVSRHLAKLAAIFRTTTPVWSIIRIAYDKDLTYRHADSVGIDYPRTYHPLSRADLRAFPFRFPLVLKPTTRERTNAFTVAKGWKVSDSAELMSRYDDAVALVGHDGIVFQEFIPGDGSNQFSYAAVWEHIAPVASLVARRMRQFPIDFGFTSTFVETVENPAIEEAASRFLSSLDYSGLVELEFKYDARDERYKLLDFNARAWTWIALGPLAGVDFPYLLVQAMTGRSDVPLRGRAGARWIHLARDIVAGGQQIMVGTLTLSAYLRTLRPPIVFAAFAWDDVLPGLLDVPLTLYRVLTRRAVSWKRAVPPV
jgi:D-aspartate ligase